VTNVATIVGTHFAGASRLFFLSLKFETGKEGKGERTSDPFVVLLVTWVATYVRYGYPEAPVV
jgi:hypothetical protein